jgi:Spy/CpxP family protein refolding chaperone
MTRRFALIGVAALALTGGAALQAQPARPGNAQERPRMEQMQRGPGFGQRQGMGQRQGQGFRRGPGGPGRPGGPGMALRGLNLTDEQKAQVKAIHEKTKADIEAVLTPEQREILKNRRGGRGGGR